MFDWDRLHIRRLPDYLRHTRTDCQRSGQGLRLKFGRWFAPVPGYSPKAPPNETPHHEGYIVVRAESRRSHLL